MQPSQAPVLDWSPLPESASDVFALLSWRTRLAPVVGQDEELAKLLAWARHSDASTHIRFLTGPGGAGKSRLAAELAATLAAQPGERWMAGFLRADVPLRIPSGRVLLIVDYPEERREFTKSLIQELVGEAGSVRLLFLSRQPAEWWRGEIDAAHAGHLVGRQAIALPLLSDDDALRLYRIVIERLRAHYGLQPALQFDSDFMRWLARNRQLNALPLFVIAAAIYAALNPAHALGYSGEDVVRALVDREIERLVGASRAIGFPREEGASRLAALAVARGGFDAAALRRFADPSLELGISAPWSIVDDVRRLPWWVDDHWPSPSPDIVAAALLFKVLKERSEYAPDWLWAAIDGSGTEAIDRLGRLTYDIGTIYGQERQRFTNWLVSMVRANVERARALSFLSEEQQMPVGILPVAIAVGQTLLSASTEDDERAWLLHNLGTDLSSAGDDAGALQASEESLEIYRRMADGQTSDLDRKVAGILTNLSVHRSEAGDQVRALNAIQEAVAIQRRLAEGKTETELANLAAGLNNLSNRLNESNRDHESLAAINESSTFSVA